MKTIGETSLIEKKINDKELFFLKVREYNRDGSYKDAEICCKLTNNAKEQLKVIKEFALDESDETPINIKDSFYAVDNYYKGEEKYTKAVLVICDIELGNV